MIRAAIIAAVAAACAMIGAAHAAEHRSRAVTQQFQRLHPCPASGRTSGSCPGWVKDHIVPLCAGGRDTAENMQWQTVPAAKAKDRIERRQCRALRAGQR